MRRRSGVRSARGGNMSCSRDGRSSANKGLPMNQALAISLKNCSSRSRSWASSLSKIESSFSKIHQTFCAGVTNFRLKT